MSEGRSQELDLVGDNGPMPKCKVSFAWVYAFGAFDAAFAVDIQLYVRSKFLVRGRFWLQQLPSRQRLE